MRKGINGSQSKSDDSCESEEEKLNRDKPDLETRKFYKRLLSDNSDIKLLINPETFSIEDCNKEACRFYGHSYRKMRSMQISDLNILPPEAIIEEMQAAVTEKKNYFYFSHRLSSGEIREVEVNSASILLKNKMLLFSIIKDVTAAKDFSARGGAVLPELHPSMPERESEIKTDTYPPISVQQKSVLEDEPFDMDNLINEVERLGAGFMANKGLTFKVRRDRKIPSWVVGNRQKTFSQLYRMVEQVASFTERRGMILGMTLQNAEEGKMRVRFALSNDDSGAVSGRFILLINFSTID